jgi:hypothetical protein
LAFQLTSDMKRVVAQQRLAYVATVCPDGTPNLSPKGTIAALDDERLVFADIRSPGTRANLASNPAIEVNVVDPFVRKGYRFKGKGRVVERGEEFDSILGFYRGRWTDVRNSRLEQSIRAFVVIEVETALPLTSPAYDDGAGEDSIRERWIAYFATLHGSNEP